MSEQVPEGWSTATIIELGNHHKDAVQTGPFGAQLHAEDYVEEGVPLILIKNIKDNGLDETDIPRITEEDAARLSRYRLKEGDIVFSRVGRVGSCFLTTPKEVGWVISGQTLRMRTDSSKVNPTYLLYALRTDGLQKDLIGDSVGTTRTSINTTILENLSVNVPKRLPEQQKIATILTSVDEVVEKTEAQISKLQDLKKGMMQELLTKGIGHTEFKDSPVGRIPKGWELHPMGELFFIQLGKMLNKDAKLGVSPYPYLANRNVQWGKADLTSLPIMDFNERERQKFELQKNDLLVCEGGEVGRSAIWEGELKNCFYQKAVHRLRVKNENAYPKFYLYFIEHIVKSNYLQNFISQTSIAHLTKENLENISVPLPPKDEQEKIASTIHAIESRMLASQNKLHMHLNIKKALMQDLLTGKVRVKTD